MEWQKSPAALIEVFDQVLPDDPRVERRQMFGFPCAFVGGNMFAGLYGPDVIVRLPEDARATVLALDGAHVFEPMAGRPMREYVVPPSKIVESPETLRAWVAQAFAYASMLPPKEKKSPVAKKKASPRRSAG